MAHENSLRKIGFVIAATAVFASAYVAASYLDLRTTDLALAHSGAQEGNVFVLQDGGYQANSAWIITSIGGAILSALFAFGIANLDHVSQKWLDHPMLSFLSLRSNPFFSIPWSRKAIDRSPLHAISTAIALVVLRLMAAVNNEMIALGHDGPLALMISFVAEKSTQLGGFVVVIGGIYVLLILLVSKPVARAIAVGRGT